MSQLNADSSDDEGVLVSRASHLNALSSDDEEEGDAGKSRNVKKSAILSSDEEGGNSQTSANLDNETTGKSGKLRRILDSSDEEENKHNEDKLDESNKTSQSLFRNKELFDAESSDDEVGRCEESSNKTKKSQISADSSEEENLNADSSDDEPTNRENINSDASSDEERNPRSSPRNRSSDNDVLSDEDHTGYSPSQTKSKSSSGHSPKGRKSKSNALSEIRSETQRMMRESSFDLPYHRPKHRTLEEFLNRKKGTPEIIHSIKEKSFSAADETRLIEREKQLEDFYKDEEEAEQVVDNEEEKTDENDADHDVSKETPEADNTETPEADNTETLEADNMETQEGCDDSQTQENSEQAITIEPEKVKPCSESLDLRLEETPEIMDSSILDSSQITQKTRQQLKLEALRKQFGDKGLEQTLNITPKLGSSKDDIFSPKSDISTGAEKLFKTFVSHVKASGHAPNDLKPGNSELNVVVKKKDSDGKEVLEVQKIDLNKKENTAAQQKMKKRLRLQEVKKQLKKEIMAKKLEEIKIKAEMVKLNNEEYDELPPEDEEMNEDAEDVEDEEYEGGDEEEEESEPEENDIPIKERKTNRNLFVEDEADESEDDLSNESDAESLDLVQQDDDDDDKENVEPKKTPRGLKFDKSDLLSDDESDSRAAFETEVTPNLETASIHSVAGSTISSSSSIFNTAPRWTPFKDRINNDQEIQQSGQGNQNNHTSPTVSQMAKKKLGFEDLFDENDPDVEDIDDIVGLCSGKFATQPQNKVDDVNSETDPEFGKQDSTRTQAALETQDTLILTGNSERNTTPIDEKMSGVDAMLSDVSDLQQQGAYPPLFEDFPDPENKDENKIDDRVETNGGGGGMRIVDSDDDEQDNSGIRNQKRKRAVISDDESDEAENNDSNKDSDDDNMEEEDQDDSENDQQLHNDIEEDEEERVVKARDMFDKKGRLRKDFFEAEAELSGSEEEVSDDEDEKGLDRLELEEGDYDDIDEFAERDKIGRVYQKNLLDEDQAELRLFQERFLEDGDLHSDNKRQRQFKWKGLDDSLEVNRRESEGEEEGDEAGTETEEWRIQRLQREKWIKENSENHVELDHTTESQFFQVAAKVMAKANSNSTSGSLTRNNSDGTGPLRPLNIMKTDQRSSFLSRGQASLETLSLFAKKVDDRAGTGAKKGRNFVFSALSPEKQDKATTEEGEDADAGGPAHTAVPIRHKKVSQPAKKQKIDRSLTSNSRSTIFNLL